ncbi:MAG TPA: glycine oxidase ThiO [Pyrinomonadaceae bacterium]|nr:glycine oxidase ThiO [Pyrinomonadaceae bacterium]
MVTSETIQAKYTTDVAIVGGGVIGLTIARALARRGLDVTLIERRELGAEASWAAGGILGPQAEADCADDFFELACKSRDLYSALAIDLLEEAGIDIELNTAGTLYLALTEADENEVARRYEWQTQTGLPVNQLSASEARQLEPLVSETVRSALFFPRDIQVDNRRLLTALIAANERFGVRLVTDTTVESLEIAHNRVTGVITSKGLIGAPRVVLAAGAWTSLISDAQAELVSQVRIEPVRGQMVCLQTKPGTAQRILYSPRGYLVPRRDGRVIAGSTTEHVGYSKQVTAAGVSTILNHTFEIAPSLSSAPISDTWSGLRPRSEDNLPVLGPCEVDGLFYATGHYRNGILLAPITGELLADAIVGNVVSPLLSRFSPHRFDLIGAK